MNKLQAIERELRDTIEIGNKIVSFYEEFLAAKNEKIITLEKQNLELFHLLDESKELLKGVLKTPLRSVIN